MHPELARLLKEIEAEARQTAPYTGIAAFDARVLQALADVPRAEFVPADERVSAYLDVPLPIGHGQTISQPFIVALMTELLDPQPGQRVLEVGTGCGYQAAVLAELAGEVYGIEIVPALARRAADTLRELGYGNVTVRAGDGWHGWPEHAPFDGIMVTAAGVGVPEPLKQQLRVGGRLVLPVEDEAGWQNLDVIERTGEGSFHTRHTIPVRFVPLTGRH